CAAFRSSSGSARIEWKFQRGSSLALIYYGGELTEPYRDRVQFSPTSIRFGSVTREDSGKYICEVVGDGSHIAKSEVNLIVQGEATPSPTPALSLVPNPGLVPCPQPRPCPLSPSLAVSPFLALSLIPIAGVVLCPQPCPQPHPCPLSLSPSLSLILSLAMSLSPIPAPWPCPHPCPGPWPC
ncbi:JAM1 protein, partial [Pheucticus melanocephalus]|nr:JAM1 protein [Pheucticus melanocephalus]